MIVARFILRHILRTKYIWNNVYTGTSQVNWQLVISKNILILSRRRVKERLISAPV